MLIIFDKYTNYIEHVSYNYKIMVTKIAESFRLFHRFAFGSVCPDMGKRISDMTDGLHD
jgi:hypothetical protein